MTRRRIVFTGGGTAGHVNPGLAVVSAFSRPRQVHWIGSGSGMERRLVEQAGIPFHRIPAGKWRRYISARNIGDIFKVALALASSLFLLARLRPALVFSKGGYVSVPPVVAARLLRIPVITHESDYDPGLATSINARCSSLVLTSFDETVRFFPGPLRSRVVTVGNPVRELFSRADPARGRQWLGVSPDRPLLVVLGGSLGAEQVNRLVREAAPALAEFCDIVHQTGARDSRDRSLADLPHYHPYPYIYRQLPDVLAAADLVVSRAGAGSLAELAYLGRPAVLIPLGLSGSRGDQIRNAAFFERAGAAVVFGEQEGTGAELSELVRELLSDRERRERMAAAMRGLARADAATRIARLIEERAG